MGSHKAKVGHLPTPILAITNITSGSVVLNWSLPRAYSEVSQYIVERGTDGVSFPTTVYTGPNLTTNDILTHQSGVVRYYRVRFLSTQGRYSAYSPSKNFVVYAPVISNSAPSALTITSAGDTYNWAQWVTDVDTAEVFTYSLPSKYRSDITINSSTGIMTVPGTAAGTSGNVTVRVTDKYNLSADKVCAITVQAAVNLPPVWATLPTLNESAGTTLNLAPYASDPNGDTPLVFSMVSQTGGHSISPTGVFTFGTSSGSATLRVTDPGLLSADTTTTVTVRAITAATWYVSDSGSDTTGNGSASLPYATLNKAISVASSGHIIELRKSGGGVWQTTQTISFNRNFSTTNPLTIRVRSGDTIRFWPSSTVARILSTTATGYVFDGSAGTIEIGNQALWSPSGGGTNTYPQTGPIGPGSNAAGPGMNYVTLKGLKLAGCAEAWGGVHYETAGDGLVIDGCNLYGHGKVPGSRDGIFMVGCGWAKVQNNFLRFYGGHGYIGMTCNKGPYVVRNNEIDGRWLEATGESYRIAEFAPSQGYPRINLNASTQPVLVENNLIYGIGLSPSDTTGNPTMKLNGRRLIYRFNYMLRCHTDKSEYNTAYLANVDGCIKHMRLYHNTYYDHWNMFTTDGNSKLANDILCDIRRINNIYAVITSKPHAEWGGVTIYTAVYRRIAQYGLQGYPNGWLGLRMDGNMINVVGACRIELDSGITGGGYVTSVGAAITRWPNQWLDTNNTNVPVFVNPSLNTRAGFELALGSPGRGQAVPMATVSSASTGTTVTLSDAYWIYDGTWIPGDVGDYIAFYNSTGTTLKGIRQVLSVNTQTSATLTQPITISSGDQVYLVLADGQTVCRNVGASQV